VPSSLSDDFRSAGLAEAAVHFWTKASAAEAESFWVAAWDLQMSGIC
jgi:hypothetical protein